MTEAGPVLSMCMAFAKEPLPVKSDACGTVVRNAELKIMDLDTGLSLPRNQPNEICIRGKQLMKGLRWRLCSMATVPHVSNEDEARDGLARSMAWSSRSQAGTPASTSEVKK